MASVQFTFQGFVTINRDNGATLRIPGYVINNMRPFTHNLEAAINSAVVKHIQFLERQEQKWERGVRKRERIAAELLEENERRDKRRKEEERSNNVAIKQEEEDAYIVALVDKLLYEDVVKTEEPRAIVKEEDEDSRVWLKHG